MTTATLVPCPGCGGRNPPDLGYCDWCGRSFVSSGRDISSRWVRNAASIALGALVVVVVVLAVLNTGRSSSARSTTPAVTSAPAPTPAARSIAASTASPRQPPTPAQAAPTATRAPEPTATPEPLRTARIANTGGLGVFLRREPSAAGPSITALREGALVTVLRREEVTAARVWRLVRDPRGLEGWVLGDYLEFLSE